MSTCSGADWYALHVRGNYEAAVVAHLRDLGVREFMPTRRTPASKKKKTRSAECPLFPGYVFCSLYLHTGPRLYSVPGIIRILGYGGRPTPIEDQEIQGIKTVIESPYPVEPHPYLQNSTQTTIADGPLTGVSGTLLHGAEECKLIVSLALIQRSLAATVPSDLINRMAPQALQTHS